MGHKDPLIINSPDVISEYNDLEYQFRIKQFFVWWGYVRPGRHSVVIKRRNAQATSVSDHEWLLRNLIMQPCDFDCANKIRFTDRMVRTDN